MMWFILFVLWTGAMLYCGAICGASLTLDNNEGWLEHFGKHWTVLNKRGEYDVIV